MSTDPNANGGAIRIGSPLRDAAVDPKPADYQAPVNAGTANPHGPNVVSVQALSPRSGNPPFVEEIREETIKIPKAEK